MRNERNLHKSPQFIVMHLRNLHLPFIDLCNIDFICLLYTYVYTDDYYIIFLSLFSHYFSLFFFKAR